MVVVGEWFSCDVRQNDNLVQSEMVDIQKEEAIKKQKEHQEAVRELERAQKQEKLAKDVGDALEISDEDKEGLVNILTGG